MFLPGPVKLEARLELVVAERVEPRRVSAYREQTIITIPGNIHP